MLDNVVRPLGLIWKDLSPRVGGLPEVEDPLHLTRVERIAALSVCWHAANRADPTIRMPEHMERLATSDRDFATAVRAYALQMSGPPGQIVAPIKELPPGYVCTHE